MILPDPIAAAGLGGLLAASWGLIRKLSDVSERLRAVETRLDLCPDLCKRSSNMKTAAPLILAPILALAALALVGCDLDPIQQETVVMAQAVAIPEQSATVTNGNAISTVIIPATVSTNYTTNVVARVNPSWTSTIQTVQALNSVANPTPFAPLVNLALGGVAGVLGLIVRAKNREITAGQAIIGAVIDGVEKVNDPRVKEAIRAAAQNAGVQPDLHSAVKGRTS